jgi:4-alpha-glucanotransferase
VDPRRRSGVLLHPTSLPGPGGIGALGPQAFRFVDWLHDSGQSVWQVLPLGPTGYGDSPYQSFSTFAGNPLLISPELLVRDGLVAERDLAALPRSRHARVDFGAVIDSRRALLHAASRAFDRERAPSGLAEERDAFREREAGWLPDFALFLAVHEEQGRPWTEWPEPLARRDPGALDEARARLADAVRRVETAQFLFFRQWADLRAHANAAGIRILGDLPLFVAHDSCDAWVHRDLFDLDDSGRPATLAGAPPDDFTEDGQLWGNPPYRWDRLRETGFDWWVARARAALRLCDEVRLDHFRGLAACWTTPAGETTARNGSWVPAAGAELLEKLEQELGGLPFVAEDLGHITPDVIELRERFALPGMRVLHFAFGGDARTNEHRPYNAPARCVIYTGTHDNETTRGWWKSGRFAGGRSRAAARAEVRALTGSRGPDIHWGLLRLAMASAAATAIVPMQDVLGLGNEARMNAPGTDRHNWTWRLRERQLAGREGDRLAALTRASGRWPEERPGPAGS